MPRTLLLASLVALLSTAAAAQTTFVETFDSGNEGEWWYGIPNPPIEPTGGNPGAYLHEPLIDTFAPQPRTQDPLSEFTGNYVVRDVTSIGVDLITFDALSADGRPLALVLNSGDIFCYTLGPNIPLVGEGWVSYDFAIPPAQTGLPAGWVAIDSTTGLPATVDWEQHISNIENVGFFYGNPEFFFIFQQWDVGMDNPRITTGSVPTGPEFVRGDTNADGNFDISDPIFALSALFVPGSPSATCADASDVNDDGSFDISDAIFALSSLFVPGSPNPAAPFPGCGEDPTDTDPLDCADFSPCP